MIAHVAVETRPADASACVEFFALLGFAEVTPPPSLRKRARWVQRGSTQVHLLFVEEPDVPPRGHVAVVADGYEATLARLREDGHEVDPRTEHWGSPRAYVRDPAGHLVEVMAFPPDG
jgi:catechol 2,3-dioxygenase-like lactoylglutathione lyase family enzyme